ncbi:phosphodiester glycosidase family protein [Paenibacillus sp.]|uniref:phosphodiester glycosidase family protein n=1 Tax=Paenibacillus sp. TaxID=58172 RepID=UPI002D626F1D|nr:phosphodiester glycosidase family protein [Paenibacillus sp.]HZG88167.1 phosphodiester glycosidase family protein [Paenibacillus sp.]
MRRRARRAIQAWLAFAVLFAALLPYGAVQASITELPDTTFGTVIDVRRTELAPGATYTWYDMHIPRGSQKAHFVEFDPKADHLELRAGTKGGKVYGMQGVTEMAAHLDAPGSRVIAGINGDFYDLTGFATGVPNGLFMDEGRILNSSISSFAFGLKADGTSIYGTPSLTRTVTIDGRTTPLTSINRYRDTNHFVLYTTDYSTSTRTSDLGDEVVLDIVSGEVKSGQTMTLRVAEVRKDAGNSPLNEGQVVLSASGTARDAIAGLEVGDELTASFQLSGEWADVELAIGGQGPLVKDGVVQSGVGPGGVHPRTAIGTKADGSIVLFEIDGRAPKFSEGVETEELAKILKDIGVVNAMNLDGGGSSTFAAKLPGTSAVKMLNRGSDGGERKTGNGLLLVNTAPELGVPAKLVVQPNAERVLKGSSFAFQAAAVDANGHPAPYAGETTWSADPAIGSFAAGGTFVASGAGAGTIRAAANGGELQGVGEVEVVETLTALRFPDAARTFAPGQTAQLAVTALRNGQVVRASNDSFEWRVEGEIGAIDSNGVFTASNGNGLSGKIYVRHGEIETSMDVAVGIPPAILEDFELGIGKYVAGGAAYNTVRISEVTDPDYVRFGSRAVKLEYDFTGKTGTSGAYLQASSVANRIAIPGYPLKLSMWVYGDGKKHWLRAQMRDGNNAAVPLDFTNQTVGVDWIGWKYLEVNVPQGRALPLSLDMPVRYMETNNAKKDAGAIYIDNIRALYGPVTEDRDPPIIKNMYPAENATVTDAAPTIRVNAEDAGYDPSTSPGTTLIDPEKIRVYVDDALVPHGLYPPEGLITYKPTVPLTEGRHKVKVAVRDLSENQTIREWYFNVNLGSPQLLYSTPDVVYAGGTYTLDLRATKTHLLRGGHIEFRFDPAKVDNLEVVRGAKLSAEQLTSVVDSASGVVRIELANVNGAGLTEADVIASVRYTVKPGAVGPIGLESVDEDVSATNTITFVSGSVWRTDRDAPTPFVDVSPTSTVRAELKLRWNHAAIGLGYPAAFAIERNGERLEGAKLLVDGVEVPGAVSDASGTLVTTAATLEAKTYTVQAAHGTAYSPVMTLKVAPPVGTATPKNISVTMGDDPATSRRLTWHTHPDTTGTVVEWVKADAFAGFEAPNVARTEGTSDIYNTNNDGTYRVHKAALTGLEPDTVYMYRVGDGLGNTSEAGTFRTSAAAGDSLKFLFFGDSQAATLDGFQRWGDVLSAATAAEPDAELLIHAGDMVDHGHEQEQWNMWFAVAQQQLMNHTLVPLVGNHEVTGTNGTGDYLAHFNNPLNGAPSAKGTNFSFDIENTHFVVMNTELSLESFEEQAAWLDQDLQASDQPWTVVLFHQGPYGSMYANTRVQQLWVPLFDKHGVDLVMNGHDHIYLRTYPMKGGAPVAEGEGTRYVIGGSSGPKFYAWTPKPWQEKVYAEEKQIYTVVEIDGGKLTVVARLPNGEEVDRFDMVKMPPPKSVTIHAPAAELAVGEQMQLQASVLPEGAAQEVLWDIVAQSPEGAATIDAQGLVTAWKPGAVTVRATSAANPSVYAETTLTVPDAIASIAFAGAGELKVGQQDATVTEAVYLSGARFVVAEGVTYASSNPDAADIDSSGVVTAKAVGTTVLTAVYGEMSASYTLTVLREDPARIKIVAPAALQTGYEQRLVVKAHYADGTEAMLNEELSFASSDPSVAAVSADGVVTALREGEVVITAAYRTFVDELRLKVHETPSAGKKPDKQ